jgi:hypothetical protein
MKKKSKPSRSLKGQPAYSPTPIALSVPVDQDVIISQGASQWKISRGKIQTIRKPATRLLLNDSSSPSY